MSKELETYVWSLGKCTGCGACVACCSRGVLYFPDGKQNPDHRKLTKRFGLSTYDIDPCFGCEAFCVEVCPRLREWGEGKMVSVVSARSCLTALRSRHGDLLSDVLNQLLVSALESGFIDGAIVTDVDRWTWQPFSRVVTTESEIYDCAGHQFIWSPTLSSLNEAVHDKSLRKIALVGAPCVIDAARMIQKSKMKGLEIYGKSLRILIGRFCGGVCTHDLVSEVIEKEMGISPRNIAMMDRSTAEKLLTVTLRDGTVREISLANTQKYLRMGCARCTDYLAESADISIGYTGSRYGYCTIITRNAAGESLLTRAVQTGHLEITKSVDTNQLYIAKRNKQRRRRSQLYDEELLLMLEGLTDPEKRLEALKRYAQLSVRR
ncbi:MAG: Coenzyme F420 hydrogenase/dehydrogenase, beta subunit C-terminal domain [Methanomassiliicoccales archaeon]|jgi:coenzyme F420 hydrogenase subunit beta|nr:Coenzyme F420 hydrogenase/dehydrogenase, beta subunit C-terminal domain [Methanomassiliicoccales archaeon]